MALLKSAPKMTYQQDLLDKKISSIPNYSTSEKMENETEASILCNPYDFIGHQDIPKIETPLSEEMQKRTLTFDELREKFQRFSNESLFKPGCIRRDNIDQKLVRVPNKNLACFSAASQY